jgi:hypothetical protein
MSVAHDCANDPIWVTTPAQNVSACKWVLVGCGIHLVVEVVEQTYQSPLINIRRRVSVFPGARTHSSFDRDGVFT